MNSVNMLTSHSLYRQLARACRWNGNHHSAACYQHTCPLLNQKLDRLPHPEQQLSPRATPWFSTNPQVQQSKSLSCNLPYHTKLPYNIQGPTPCMQPHYCHSLLFQSHLGSLSLQHCQISSRCLSINRQLRILRMSQRIPACTSETVP